MAAATMYVTVAGAGNKDGTDWDNAFGLSEWETDVEGSAEAGDIYYVKEGTYTLTQDYDTALDGSNTSNIKVIGVKTETVNEPPVFSDWAFGSDRPLIAASDNVFGFGDYWQILNLRVTTTNSTGMRVGAYSIASNCDVNNSSETANRYAIYASYSMVRIIGCETQSANGYAVRLGNYSNCCFSFLHNSEVALYTGSYNSCIGNVVDTCTTGLFVASSDGHTIINNTIYNCTTGISGTDGFCNTIINNVIDACGTGAAWTTEQESNFIDYNCWDNITDVSNVTKGNNAVTADPGMNNPGNDDFSIASGDAAYDVGLDAGDYTGATV